jgi:CBS domain-containing protein
MRVAQIMSRDVAVCKGEDSLRTAAQIMWDRDCGCVPVVAYPDGEQRVVAMITDRDICMAALHQRRGLEDMTVESAMSREIFACRPDDPVELAVKILQEKQVHRLPVIDGDGRLAGILSLADVAREARREHAAASREVSDFEVAETVEAISLPREATLH